MDRTKIKTARLILFPEDRRLKAPVADSRRRFGHMINASVNTVKRIENDPEYQIGKTMMLRIEAQIRKAYKKLAKEK